MTVVTVTDAAELLRMEFAEVPGLALKPWQAQQVCRIPGEVCDQALRVLEETGFLRRTADGRYWRRGSAATGGSLVRMWRQAH